MITPFGEIPNRLAVGMSMAEQHDWLRRGLSRRQVLAASAAVGLTGALVSAGPARAADTLYPLLGRQIAYGPDPTRQMVVAVAVKKAVRNVHVVVSVDGRQESTTTASIQTVPDSTMVYARADIQALEPNTRYDYTVVVDNQEHGKSSFRTAADGAHAFRFTAFGDQGTGSLARDVLAEVVKAKPDFHLFAGDLSYADQSGMGGPGDIFRPAYWDGWIQQNDPVAATTPWMCVPGNHEMEPGFGLHGYAGWLTRVAIGGASPPAIPVATRFRVGTVGFVGLDSNDVSYELPANRGWTQTAQTAWLETVLQDYRATGAGIDFIVAFMHAGPYTTSDQHPCEGGIREAWVPLFDKYGVDIVISGHNHVYERTLPIRAGKPAGHDPAHIDPLLGTTYVTAGGGGASSVNYTFISTPQARVRDAEGQHKENVSWSIPNERRQQHNVAIFDLAPAAKAGDNTTLTMRVLNNSGNLIDRAVFTRTATAGLTAVAATTSSPVLLPWVIGGGGAVVVGGAVGAVLLVHSRRVRAVAVAAGGGPAGPGRAGPPAAAYPQAPE